MTFGEQKRDRVMKTVDRELVKEGILAGRMNILRILYRAYVAKKSGIKYSSKNTEKLMKAVSESCPDNDPGFASVRNFVMGLDGWLDGKTETKNGRDMESKWWLFPLAVARDFEYEEIVGAILYHGDFRISENGFLRYAFNVLGNKSGLIGMYNSENHIQISGWNRNVREFAYIENDTAYIRSNPESRMDMIVETRKLVLLMEKRASVLEPGRESNDPEDDMDQYIFCDLRGNCRTPGRVLASGRFPVCSSYSGDRRWRVLAEIAFHVTTNEIERAVVILPAGMMDGDGRCRRELADSGILNMVVSFSRRMHKQTSSCMGKCEDDIIIVLEPNSRGTEMRFVDIATDSRHLDKETSNFFSDSTRTSKIAVYSEVFYNKKLEDMAYSLFPHDYFGMDGKGHISLDMIADIIKPCTAPRMFESLISGGQCRDVWFEGRNIRNNTIIAEATPISGGFCPCGSWASNEIRECAVIDGDILVTKEGSSALVKTDNGWSLAFADSHSYIIRCKRHADPYFIKAFLDSDMGKDVLKSYIRTGRIDKTPIPIMYEEDVKLISKCMRDIVHEKLTEGSRYDSELRSIQNVFGKME